MRVRALDRISLLIALAAIALAAPGATRASDEKRPFEDAAPASVAPSDGSDDSQPGYAHVLIAPLEVGFTKGFLASRDLSAHRIQGSDVEKLRRHYREVVTSRLASAYAVSPEPGPRVIRMEAFLIDQVLDKRDWLAPAKIVYRSAPRVRVIVFLRDSQNGELVDTVSLGVAPHANHLMKDSPGFYWHFMRQVFDRVATRVRWSLDDETDPS